MTFWLIKQTIYCGTYKWLHQQAKGFQGHPNLNSYFINESTYYLNVCKVKELENYSNNGMSYILSSIPEGLFIVVLEDTSSGNTHTIGINIWLNVIYDGMETHEM